MSDSLKVFLRKYGVWIAVLLSLAGGWYFAHQTWGYIHTLTSDVLDESLYFQKGYMFALGKYKPFQDYGPLTNHMPLSFMIPGWVQVWFGAGLRTGRYYVFALGILIMLGYWLAAYRLGGAWWGAFVVWAVALSKFYVQIFSLGLVQGLVNVLLAWMLVFAFDQRGRWWQMALAGIFGGMLVTTRVNLLPVVAFFVLYALSLHGWRAAIAAGLASGLTIGVVHYFYWPDILKLWAYWIPEGIIPYVDTFRSPWRQFEGITLKFFPIRELLADRSRPEWSSWRAFWRGMRLNFLSTYGVMAAMLLSARKRALVSRFHRSSAFFLIASYLVLLVMHMWAALTARSCTFFCFENYLVFFNLIGLLAVVASFPQWPYELPFLKEFGSLELSTLFLVGVNYSADINYTPFKRWLLRFLKDGLPWLRQYIGASDVELWVILHNKFGFDYYAFLNSYTDYEQFLPLAEVLLLVVIGIPLVYSILSMFKFKLNNFGRFAALFILALGLALAPTKRLAGKTDAQDCKSDVLVTYESVGKELSEFFPSGSLVFWQVKSNSLLLYMPDVEIFPPQLNMFFSKIEGDDFSDEELDSMERYAFWNDQLDDRWKDEADYIVVENRFYLEDLNDWRTAVETGSFKVVLRTDPVEACRGDGSELLVLQKAKSGAR